MIYTISAKCRNERCGKTGWVYHGVCNIDEDSYNCTCNPGFAPASPNYGPRDRVHYCMSKFFSKEKLTFFIKSNTSGCNLCGFGIIAPTSQKRI